MKSSASGDQRKLDDYLTSVREIERRLDRVETISRQITPKHPPACPRTIKITCA